MIFGLTCSSPHAGSITTAWTVKFVLSLVLSALVCTLFTLEIVSNTMKFLPQAYQSLSLGSGRKFFGVLEPFLPPVDLHWFFEISIRTEKKNQLVYN